MLRGFLEILLRLLPLLFYTSAVEEHRPVQPLPQRVALLRGVLNQTTSLLEILRAAVAQPQRQAISGLPQPASARRGLLEVVLRGHQIRGSPTTHGVRKAH